MDLLLAFILAMALTVALIPALMRRAGAMHVLDEPAERKVHARPMPRVGGIAMAVGVAVPLLLWLDLDRLTAAYLASALIVLLFGVWDDRATLSPGIKFLGQLIAVHIVVLVGGRRDPFPDVRVSHRTAGDHCRTAHGAVPARRHQRDQPVGRSRRAGGWHDLPLLRGDRTVELSARTCVCLDRRRRRHGQLAGLSALQQLSGPRVHGRRRQPVPRFHSRRAGRVCSPRTRRCRSVRPCRCCCSACRSWTR